MGEPERKRRKWDVAAPGGVPTVATHAPSNVMPANQQSMSFAPSGQLAGYASVPPSQPTTGTIAYQPAPGQAPQAIGFGAMPGTAGRPPGTPAQLNPDVIRRAQEAAAAVVGRITQGAALGKQQLPDIKAEICREVTINDAPSFIRIHLTKRSVQDEIMQRTGTVIVVKGRYYPPGAPVDDKEKPLYLRVTPGAASGEAEDRKYAAVAAAAAEIQNLLQGRAGTPPASLPAGPPAAYAPPTYPAVYPPAASAQPPAPAPAPQGPPSLLMFVGVSNAPTEFNLLDKIKGPGGSYLNHISSQSGATVQIRGRGSVTAEGPEPLHLFISGPTAKAVDDAKGLSMDLLATVKDDLLKRYPSLASSVGPSTVTSAMPEPTQPQPLQHPAYTYPPAAAPYGAAAPYPAPTPYAVPQPYSGPPPYAALPGQTAAPLQQPMPYYPPPGVPVSYPPAAYPPPTAAAGRPAMPVTSAPASSAPPAAAPAPHTAPIPAASAAYPPPGAPAVAPYPPAYAVPYYPPPGFPAAPGYYAPPPAGYAAMPAYAPVPMQPAAAPQTQQQGQQQQQPQQQQGQHSQQQPQQTESPPKRKFREFKGAPDQVALASGQAPAVANGGVYAQYSAAINPSAGTMGPPPPRVPQGPGTSNSAAAGAANSNANVTGSLAGLLSYGDD